MKTFLCVDRWCSPKTVVLSRLLIMLFITGSSLSSALAVKCRVANKSEAAKEFELANDRDYFEIRTVRVDSETLRVRTMNRAGNLQWQLIMKKRGDRTFANFTQILVFDERNSALKILMPDGQPFFAGVDCVGDLTEI